MICPDRERSMKMQFLILLDAIILVTLAFIFLKIVYLGKSIKNIEEKILKE